MADRNLVVCCDGTWNSPDMIDTNGAPIPTNVVRISNAVVRSADQLVYYHSGVGTGPMWMDHVLGGITGQGLVQNVKSAYFWLGKHYKSGDKIFLFGFSRGAYTARAVAGMIARCGLLDLQSNNPSEAFAWALVDELFERYYADGSTRDIPNTVFFDVDPETKTGETSIWFVGVWDTVGSLGIPSNVGFSKWFNAIDKQRFRDTILSPKVQNARHAMGLDEMRANFLPTFWELHEDGDPNSLKQVWFPGSHGNVGGGYGETSLSDGALLWMIEEAHACGLAFDDAVVKQIAPKSLGVLNNSVIDIYKKLFTAPRAVPYLDQAAPGSDFHQSAIDRQVTVPITAGAYRRGRKLQTDESETYRIEALQHWNATGLFLEKNVEYEFTAVGEWVDGSIKFDPDGNAHNNSLHTIIHLLLSGLGRFEVWLRKVTGNHQIKFFSTKRQDAYPWFALIGVIINGRSGVTNFRADETFKIGHKARHTPKRDGYFYAYANDAWNAYNNNKGAVHVTVTRKNEAAVTPPASS